MTKPGNALTLAAFFLCASAAEAQLIHNVVPPINEPVEDDGEPIPAVRDDKGRCLVPKEGLDEGLARYACLKVLLPRRPRPVLATPGTFFIGYAWGEKSTQWVYGPQVGVSGSVAIPIKRPYLERMTSENDHYVFRPPSSMSLTFDVAISLSANFAALSFPNSTEAALTKPTQQTANIGVYVAPELGWSWWTETGNAHRFAFSFGLMAGYIDTEATGAAFALGLQPGLIAQF